MSRYHISPARLQREAAQLQAAAVRGFFHAIAAWLSQARRLHAHHHVA